MDLVQDQVSLLNTKVDALQGTVEQLQTQAADILAELKLLKGDRTYLTSGDRRSPYSSRSSFESEMEHKDVLSDSSYLESDGHSGDRSLTPEVQVQRLTAQLTAAYNRIAALEEQLLAKRIH